MTKSAVCLEVAILPEEVPALLPTMHLSDHVSNCALLWEALEEGDVISNLVCLSRNKESIVSFSDVFKVFSLDLNQGLHFSSACLTSSRPKSCAIQPDIHPFIQSPIHPFTRPCTQSPILAHFPQFMHAFPHIGSSRSEVPRRHSIEPPTRPTSWAARLLCSTHARFSWDLVYFL